MCTVQRNTINCDAARRRRPMSCRSQRNEQGKGHSHDGSCLPDRAEGSIARRKTSQSWAASSAESCKATPRREARARRVLVLGGYCPA
jgi:hypothetical protein